MTPLNKILDEIKEREEAATEGPWEFIDTPYNQFVSAIIERGKTRSEDKLKYICALAGLSSKDNDFAFIAHARTDIPFLLEVVEYLEKEISYYDPEPEHIKLMLEEIAAKHYKSKFQKGGE